MMASPKRPIDGSEKTSTAKKAKMNDEPGKGEAIKKPQSAEMKLQQSLLQKDKELAKVFLSAVKGKPEGVGQKQIVRQFWASREHLLRAHAAELEQRRADYNVLSEVKPKNVEGAIKLNITPEQVEDIFRQHPVVRIAYNDTVPDKYANNMSFWSSFFVSRLFKKLKGERISEADPQNPSLDRYMGTEYESQKGKAIDDQHIPHFIDLEGNEQNHSQRKGNQPDHTMRPNGTEKVPILSILNRMSEKIMAQAHGRGGGIRHVPIGLDEANYDQLRLHDLQENGERAAIRLRVRAKQQFNTDRNPTNQLKVQTTPGRDPQQALSQVRDSLESASTTHVGFNDIDLAEGIAFPEDSENDSDSEDDNETSHDQTRNSQRSSYDLTLDHANSHVQSLLAQQTDSFSSTSDPSTRGDISLVARTLQMPPAALQDLLLTHQTTNEFLHYFWQLLLMTHSSGTELAPLLATLEKSLERMASAANNQEAIRIARLNQLKKKAHEDQMRFKHRVTVDEKDAGPGKKEVERLLEPMVVAIDVAKGRFEQTMTA